MNFFTACGIFIERYFLIIASILLVWNLVTMFTYAADKAKAKKGAWRIPEATLIGFAWAFGGVGALLGMYVFRHKTKHTKFKILVPMAFILQLAFFVLCSVAANR